MTDPALEILARVEQRLERLENALTSQPPKPAARGLISVNEVAGRWGCPARRVRDLHASGRLRGVRIGQRGLRFSLDEIARFEAAR